MNLSIIKITWLHLSLFITSTIADSGTCSDTSDDDYYSDSYECYRSTITCNNITNFSSLKSKTDCEYCVKLIVMNSNFSTVDKNLLVPNFCSLLEITLSNCRIETVSEDAFSEFINTRTLDLSQNKIKNLRFLGYVRDLKYLNLLSNELTQVNSSDFTRLRGLQILNIAHNDLVSIGNGSYKLESLEEFYLNNNKIVTIQANVFQKLSSLKVLNLGENKIELIYRGMFDGLNQLQTLYLQQNFIKSIGSYSFKGLNRLRTIHLSGNSLLSEISDYTFFSCKSLNFLDLSHSNISSIGLQAFPEGISVEYLDLSNNSFKAIPNRFPNLVIRKLHLENNPLTLQSNGNISTVTEFLDLSGSNLTVLSENFLGITELQKLKLTNTNLSIIRSHAFQGVNIKKLLDLSHNKIETLHPSTFEGLSNLQDLDLSYNPIMTISDSAFTGLELLSTLWLSGNNLTVQMNSFRGISMPDLHLSFIEGRQLNLGSWGFNNLDELTFSNTTIRNLGTEAFYGLLSTPEFSLCTPVYDSDSLNLCNASLESIQPNALKGRTYSFVNYDFSYNSLTYILANTFQDMKDVNVLQLSNNNISVIHSLAFHNISFCDTISHHYKHNLNFISINCTIKSIYLSSLTNLQLLISKNAFTEIHNVKNLHLEHSNVTEIEPFAFETISFCNTDVCYGSIYLNFNNIGTIASNTFNNILDLTELYLDHSNIKTIESNAFASIKFSYGYEINVDPRHGNINEEVVHFIYLNEAGTSVSVIKGQAGNSIYLNDNLLEKLERDSFRGISNLNELHLENNKIKRVQKLAFDDLHFHPHILNNTINLNSNQIYQLVEGAFNGIFNLKVLLISHNNISLIEPKTFLPLKELVFLDLSYNALSVIHSNYFELNSLQTLNLSHNKIFTLTSESFTSVNNLKTLILSQNLLDDFPLGTFKNFPWLERLELSHNQLSKFKTGIFSNLAQLNSLDLSYNKFDVVDESILYPLHKLESLMLNNNMLSVMNYISLLEHLPTLEYISIHNNNWDCKLLIVMLRTFKLRNVTYLSVDAQNYTIENVDGISCTESTPDMIDIEHIHSENSPELLNDLAKLIQYSNYNIKELVSAIKTLVNQTELIGSDETANKPAIDNNSANWKFLKENSQNLLAEMQTFLNISSSKNDFIKQYLNNNSELLAEVRQLVNLTHQSRKESSASTNELLELLLESSQQSVNYSLHNFSMQKVIDDQTDNSQSRAPDYSAALYLIMLVSIAILCLLGFNAYKKYFQSNLNKNQNQRSELELVGSN